MMAPDQNLNYYLAAAADILTCLTRARAESSALLFWRQQNPGAGAGHSRGLAAGLDESPAHHRTEETRPQHVAPAGFAVFDLPGGVLEGQASVLSTSLDIKARQCRSAEFSVGSVRSLQD